MGPNKLRARSKNASGAAKVAHESAEAAPKLGCSDKPAEYGPAASRPACFLGFFLRARSSPAQAPSHAPVIFCKESVFALKTGLAAFPGGALVRLRGAPAGVPRSSSLVIHLSTIDMETT